MSAGGDVVVRGGVQVVDLFAVDVHLDTVQFGLHVLEDRDGTVGVGSRFAGRLLRDRRPTR